MCVSACVSVLISVTLLPALVLCQQEVRASSTLPSDRHTDTHTEGATIPPHPGTSPKLALQPGLHSPAPPGDPALPGSGGQPPPSSAGRQGERKEKKKSYLCHSVTSSSSLFQLSPLLKPLLKPPQSHHKSHPCLRGAAKAQLSLWTCSKIPWVKKGSATRLIMTLEQLNCAQGMTQSPDPSGCQAGGLCPVPLHGCPARRRRRRRMRAGKPARTQR